MTYSLIALIGDIQRACETLNSEVHGALTERQRARVAEIHACSLDLAKSITRYEMMRAAPVRGQDDPGGWLMYAAKTPLTMIGMSTRLMMMAHLRQGEPLTRQQHLFVRAIETAGQKLVNETERMWSATEANY